MPKASRGVRQRPAEVVSGLHRCAVLVTLTGTVPLVAGDGDQFMDALERVAGGGTALDASVVAQLLGTPAHADPLSALSEREGSVLALMAEGRSNSAIAARLYLSEGAISKHTTTIFAKLGLMADEDTNRRVRAVLTYLQAE